LRTVTGLYYWLCVHPNKVAGEESSNEACQIDSWLWHQDRPPDGEVEEVDDDVYGAVAVGLFNWQGMLSFGVSDKRFSRSPAG
jgi:hypothetical protein